MPHTTHSQHRGSCTRRADVSNPSDSDPARAIVLFAHGSRDPRWAEPLHALKTAIQRAAQAQQRAVTVRLAFLEFMSPALPVVLTELAAAGRHRIELMPVFWADGGHVMSDLPRLIGEAKAAEPALQVQVLPTLSRWPGLLDWLAHGWLAGAAGDAGVAAFNAQVR